MSHDPTNPSMTPSTTRIARASKDLIGSPYPAVYVEDNGSLVTTQPRRWWRVRRALLLVGTLALVIAIGAVGVPSVSAQRAPGGDISSRTVPTISTPPVSPGGVIIITPSVYQVAVQATLATPNAIEEAAAPCRSGDIALSGGWSIPLRSDLSVLISRRLGLSSWMVFINHSTPVTVSAYANCLHNSGLSSITERLVAVTVQPGTTNHALAVCNSGEVLVGGGFSVGSSSLGLEVTSDIESVGSPAAPTGWYTAALSHRASAGILNSVAECLAMSGSHPTARETGQITVGRFSTGGLVSPLCPLGYLMTGGGYGYTGGHAFLFTNASDASATVWTASLYGESEASYLLQSTAVCVKF